MQTRKIGPFDVSAISFGCMSMSQGYGAPDREESTKALNLALDLGYSMLDTAALYGFGHNETLLGEAVSHRRNEFMLASKCGIFRDEEGKREINGRPEVLKKTCEDGLKRLKTDVIDLYYLHRYDYDVPVEDSIGALADLKRDGKIRSIGISEVSADTLRKAHAEHPIAAIQSEYSLWTRNPERAVLQACEELGITFVAFSPLARKYLTGTLTDMEQTEANDLRRNMPRFQGNNWTHNVALLQDYLAFAKEKGCTPGQLALAWLLAQKDFIIPIPGTKHTDFVQENLDALNVELSSDDVAALDQIINEDTVAGMRYNEKTAAEVDSEKDVQ